MEEPHINSDPEIKDRDRAGNDLLARIDELTVGKTSEGSGDGWRFLLLAAAVEIRKLRRELRDIADAINQREDERKFYC